MTFFILGTHPELSLAEIQAVLGQHADSFFISEEVLVTKTDVAKLEGLQMRLGGIMKTGTIIKTLPSLKKNEVADLIVEHSLSTAESGKISFGISTYGKRNFDHRKHTEAIGLEAKKLLKASGRPVRFVTSKEAALSSVIVDTNKLIKTGGEFVIIKTPQGFLIGKTQTVQDFREWSRRDFGRPRANPKSGMLPPKVARMMINLSGADPKTATLLDPFCGSGTIPMEAAVLGFKHVIASDVNKEATNDTRKNVDWLGKGATLRTVHMEAQHLSLQKPVDVIVTEPSLGPALKGREAPTQIQNIVRVLTELYTQSFTHLYPLLKPGGKAVVAFPMFRKTKTSAFEKMEAHLKRMGFKIEGRYPYERADQHVGREIIVMSKS